LFLIKRNKEKEGKKNNGKYELTRKLFEGENCLLGFFQKNRKTSSICAIRCFNAFHLSFCFMQVRERRKKDVVIGTLFSIR
jgi:hypothetical protein